MFFLSFFFQFIESRKKSLSCISWSILVVLMRYNMIREHHDKIIMTRKIKIIIWDECLIKIEGEIILLVGTINYHGYGQKCF